MHSCRDPVDIIFPRLTQVVKSWSRFWHRSSSSQWTQWKDCTPHSHPNYFLRQFCNLNWNSRLFVHCVCFSSYSFRHFWCGEFSPSMYLVREGEYDRVVGLVKMIGWRNSIQGNFSTSYGIMLQIRRTDRFEILFNQHVFEYPPCNLLWISIQVCTCIVFE